MYLKTLTPERRVSESGLRFLNPQLGRFVSRDPTADLVRHEKPLARSTTDGAYSLHSYVFVEDGSAGSPDYLGLHRKKPEIDRPVLQLPWL